MWTELISATLEDYASEHPFILFPSFILKIRNKILDTNVMLHSSLTFESTALKRARETQCLVGIKNKIKYIFSIITNWDLLVYVWYCTFLLQYFNSFFALWLLSLEKMEGNGFVHQKRAGRAQHSCKDSYHWDRLSVQITSFVIIWSFSYLSSVQHAHLCMKTLAVKNPENAHSLKSEVHQIANVLYMYIFILRISLTYFYNKEYLALQASIHKKIYTGAVYF